MDPRVRDALLAAGCGVALLGALAWLDATAVLWQPTAAASGITGALLVEAAFVADTPARRLWERRSVQAVSVAVLLGGGAVAAVVFGPWALAAACWGLATYFALLALLVSGRWPGEN